ILRSRRCAIDPRSARAGSRRRSNADRLGADVGKMTIRLAIVVLLLAPLADGARASPCHRSCAEALRECRRDCMQRPGAKRHTCVRTCGERSTCTAPGAAIRTGAYVVTRCTTDLENRASWSQTLVVRRRNCDPVPVVEFSLGPAPDPGICLGFGLGRIGDVSVQAGVLQRIGVQPDGS